MKIALIGYGKMGREIEAAAREAGTEVVAVFNSRNNPQGSGIRRETLAGAEVGIDFSTRQAVLDNIRSAAACRLPVVVGTTGWYERLEEAKRIVEEEGTGLVYAPNFSIGVNLFLKIVAYAGRLFERFADYDPYIIELHHRQKADSPSGTALELGRALLGALSRKREIQAAPPEGRIQEDRLHVASIRAGYIFGTHIVGFDSPHDSIRLEHEARSRRGFALGALLAARWIVNRKGVFTFQEILDREDLV